MAAIDTYATGKANLRDNVKTLMTVFAGVAGVLLAGTPFSGFGSLPLGPRLTIASLALAGAVILVGFALHVLLDMLRPDIAYAGFLRDDFDLTSISDRTERSEVAKLRAEWSLRRVELLPGGVANSLEALGQSIEQLQEEAAESARTGSPATAALDKAKLDAYIDSAASINNWAGFTRLHQRVRAGMGPVFALGFGALLCIGVFSWATSARADAAVASTVVVEERIRPPDASPASAPAFGPILFETGKAELSKDAISRIGEARDHLRRHANTGLLVYAYTDTQGKDAFNDRLARDRARAVVRALLAPGGIAASRVFVAELPLTDLPVLTAPQVDRPENRSVQLAVVPLPER